ncbi:hypothetical protein JY651_21205 [Pyxidicoccus parkwayensis]|uniref:Lipoprotein n=1 Tax=Pyxidicoccus parkwayensis TaxID=2813578 RepID=A0ABX7PA13_9BACT|nr:hypothetical protein [Pyxidicoccus parkwaysis]QSQ27276.1 hypothetical protein JY651_21205 [Pyxidicoccus parkwaysis]
MARRPCRPLPVSLCLLVLAFSGCGPALHEETESPAPSSQTAEIRIANSLTTDALVLNAILTNPTANGLLASSPLTSLFGGTATSGNPYISMQLHDPDAQKFMEYLVGCALNDGDTLDWYDPRPASAGPKKWYGKAGLCPDWESSAPSGQCKRLVSACILARNNALGRRVELSIRGEHWTGPGVFTMEPVTRPAEHDPNPSVALNSFTPCPSPQSGAARNCGWKADAIGSCVPGSLVWVGAGGPTSCPGAALGSSSGGQTVLRVCNGVVGCDHLGARYITEATGSCMGIGSAPATSFTCPGSGWFSVMTAPWNTVNASATATVDVSSSVGARYNLSEQEVYGMREGAFYGNVFDPAALHPKANVYVSREGDTFKVNGDDVVIQGAIYRQMFSCYDPSWTAGAAYSSNRVCALPSSGENCAATVAGPCWPSATSPIGRCILQDGPDVPGDGDFEMCQDTAGILWNEPVTTYLNSACDTVQLSAGTRTCGRK